MRLGIFGGSFDPPHIGHFLAAVDAAEQLQLDRLLWIPTALQPLKAQTPHHASPESRFRMVAAATMASPSFVASRIEIDRSGLSYTVTTLEALEREYPAAERFLLVGEDSWSHFGSWHQPEKIRTLVQIAVLCRAVARETPQGGVEGAGSGRGASTVDRMAVHAAGSSSGAGPRTLDPDRFLKTRQIDVSATEIRARRQSGKSIRGFVQDAVADIIESEGLYRW